MKAPRNGFTTYSTTDGLKTMSPAAITEDRAGRLCAITSDTSIVTLNDFDGRLITSVSPRPPGDNWDWGDAQVIFLVSLGDWMINALLGVFRFAPPGLITH